MKNVNKPSELSDNSPYVLRTYADNIIEVRGKDFDCDGNPSKGGLCEDDTFKETILTWGQWYFDCLDEYIEWRLRAAELNNAHLTPTLLWNELEEQGCPPRLLSTCVKHKKWPWNVPGTVFNRYMEYSRPTWLGLVFIEHEFGTWVWRGIRGNITWEGKAIIKENADDLEVTPRLGYEKFKRELIEQTDKEVRMDK